MVPLEVCDYCLLVVHLLTHFLAAHLPTPIRLDHTLFFDRFTSRDLISAYQYAYFTIAKPLTVGNGITYDDDVDLVSTAFIEEVEENTATTVTQCEEFVDQVKCEDLLRTLATSELLSAYCYGYYRIVKVFSFPPAVNSRTRPLAISRLVVKSETIGLHLQRASVLAIEDVPPPPVCGPYTGEKMFSMPASSTYHLP